MTRMFPMRPVMRMVANEMGTKKRVSLLIMFSFSSLRFMTSVVELASAMPLSWINKSFSYVKTKKRRGFVAIILSCGRERNTSNSIVIGLEMITIHSGHQDASQAPGRNWKIRLLPPTEECWKNAWSLNYFKLYQQFSWVSPALIEACWLNT